MKLKELSIGCFLIVLIALIIFILFGCGAGYDNDNIKGDWYYTPDGYVIKIPDSIFINGLYLPDHIITDRNEIIVILKSFLDQGISDWFELRGIKHIDKVRHINFIVHDHWFFKINNSMCAGYFIGNNIELALYWKSETIEYPTMNFAVHTLIWHEDDQEKGVWKWYAGYIPESNIGIPALSHELDHVIGINND